MSLFRPNRIHPQQVSHTVNQINYALPGNAVTKEYDVFEHIASAGPGK